MGSVHHGVEVKHQETEALGCFESVVCRRESRMLILILNVDEFFCFSSEGKESSLVDFFMWLVPGGGEVLNE